MSVDVKYRTSATETGGRDGRARSDDGQLEVQLARPRRWVSGRRKQVRPYSNATRNNVDVGLTIA